MLPFARLFKAHGDLTSGASEVEITGSQNFLMFFQSAKSSLQSKDDEC